MKDLIAMSLQALALILCAVSVTALPPFPEERSEVSTALELITSAQAGGMTPEKLVENLYLLSVSENDAARPHAIHHQLQSQAFYRMMINRATHFKVMTAPHPGAFRADQAYRAFDNHVRGFWKQFSPIYITKYKDRERRTRELKDHDPEAFMRILYPELPENEPFDQPFMSGYTELPEDKKRATEYLNKKNRAVQFGRHVESVHAIGVHRHILPMLTSTDPAILRVLSSAETSTSRRPTNHGDD
ncbi:hypothetical protein EX895_003056 [Sporisorium graminicola]|uniref:Uncharacterized protein n=1 Tax=Sporisorium graminicola TaxID=280036 RepID=A0A4U7KTY2_9BASI|nr:hypothetical protein EX895_003056 [Sporisorium graminicola]TKY87960.1 hypothetical protein EX895_003056 [Sporisorium graminicola]